MTTSWLTRSRRRDDGKRITPPAVSVDDFLHEEKNTMNGRQMIEPSRFWGGMLSDPALLAHVPLSGAIVEQASWERLWRAWRPDEAVPGIDFRRELVIVGVTGGPNAMNLQLQCDEQGNLEVNIMTTLIAEDGKHFGYQLAVIDREGIHTVRGQVPGIVA